MTKEAKMLDESTALNSRISAGDSGKNSREIIALDDWRDDEARRIVRGREGFDCLTRLGEELLVYYEYRALVRDDVRPPVVVDRAGECLAKVTLQLAKSDEDKATYIIRSYGDERFAEGERAGIERINTLTKALKEADSAITEMFRYFDGGETRGSYDGKPERNQLRKAGYTVRAVLGEPK